MLVEGALALAVEVGVVADLKIFAHVDDDTRLLRRIRRDTLERGRGVEEVLAQYERTVKPMHDEFVLPSKTCADVVLPEGGLNSCAVDIMAAYIAAIVRGAGE